MMLLGQGDAYQGKLAQARVLEMHHGLLLCGARGTGKSRAAKIFAHALLDAGDGADPGCWDRVEAGQHPDLHELSLVEDQTDIPIDSVRGLQRALSLRPVEGRARVAIIDPADRLNAQGQNALLKILEEPGPATFLILVTSRPESLLETVRSRVDRLGMLPLSREILLDGLAHQALLEPQILEWAAATAAGSLGRALRLGAERARELDAEIAGFLGSRDRSRDIGVSLLAGVKGRRESEERLDMIMFLLRHHLRSQLQVALANGDTEAYLEMWINPWYLALEQVLQAEEDLALQIGAAQVLADLFLKLGSILDQAGARG